MITLLKKREAGDFFSPTVDTAPTACWKCRFNVEVFSEPESHEGSVGTHYACSRYIAGATGQYTDCYFNRKLTGPCGPDGNGFEAADIDMSLVAP
jgi:hypothetical protein